MKPGAAKAKPGTRRRVGKKAPSMKSTPERTAPGRRWISPAECAVLVGVHPMTVYDLVNRGELPAARLGRKLLIDRIRLEQDLERQAAGQAGKKGRP
jgi:excisionase family DNA binding protein